MPLQLYAGAKKLQVKIGDKTYKIRSAETEALIAPTISLDGDTLTITSADERTETFAIFVDGEEVATVDLLTHTEGLAYELSADGTYYICAGIGTATDTDIVIASEINGIPVTLLKDSAFRNNSDITSVKIPDSVTGTTGSAVFRNCSNLIKVNIPNWTIIHNSLFYDCVSLTDITFNGTTTQWQSVTKGTDWNYNVPVTYVQCTDGTVSI